MGQRIEVAASTIDDIAMFDTDRAITGQDGAGFDAAAAAEATSIPGRLAARLFNEVAGIDHVFIASNQVVIRRPHGWDDHVVSSAGQVIEEYFLYY